MNSLKLAILRALYFSPNQSIAELSDWTGKSIPLITKAINELIEDELIVSCGLRASTGGRRAMHFILNADKQGCIVVVAMDQYATNITVVNLANQQLLPIKKVTSHLWDDPDTYTKIVDSLTTAVSEFPKNKVLSIGITMPGFVDSKKGINSSFPSKSPLYNLRENIQSHFGIPTYLENDSASIAIAEKNFGLIKEAENALVVNLNWGVGLGMIVDGKLFKGHSGFAGEFSHIPLADEDKLCSCGKKGCLEVAASLLCAIEYIIEAIEDGQRSSLEKIYNERRNLTLEDVREAYIKGDQVTIIAIRRIAYMLGKGIATLIHILNPETIVISGKGAMFGDVLLPQIQSSIQEYCIPRLAKCTTIQISEINDVQLLASACIAVQRMRWDNTQHKQLTKAKL
ncbi:ROK family transcriptional regulator [Sphingobacterium sp. SGR-19]|uniref:ROK family transcriptional regulator n=1 Tax=Sphingobacterium sp. SGR-19 TaxID=2710886 RepID=UPI0013EA4F82|nr:ROK family transcriptional regulator [Sphingobacterium sp. SGR-19]NGM64669.1 ROK family transcriptional regulator [Sphingobacterium sp. SGR-19]